MRKPTITNIAKATPDELKWLTEHRCKHGHPYISHFNCFRTEHETTEKVGCLDIETSNLDADFGMMLSWSIMPLNKDKPIYRVLSLNDLSRGNMDKKLVESLYGAMVKFDRIITHYGTYFDLPFIRTRAVIHRLPFPAKGTLYHTDVWRLAKTYLKLSSNRQDSVARAILGNSIKTHMDPQLWAIIQFGSRTQRKAGLDYVIDHNIKDVIQLRENYLALKPYIREIHSSI